MIQTAAGHGLGSTARTIPSRADVSRRLEQLANDTRDFHPETAARLQSVSDALIGGSTAQWRGLDLMATIGPDRLPRLARPQNRLVGFVEKVRDVAMLLPIVVTWIGVFLAVAAYDVYAGHHRQDAQQSFLYLWETGFGSQPYLRLSTVALLDACTIGLIIVLVAGLPLLERALDRGRARRLEGLSNDIHSALSDAAIYLNGDPDRPVSDQAAAVERKIVTSLTGGADVLEPVLEMARAVAHLSSRIDELVQGQERLAERMTETLDGLQETAGALTAGSQALQHAAQTLIDGEQRFVEERDRHLAAQAQLVNSLRQVSQPMEETLRGARDYAQMLRGLAAQLQQTNDDMLRYQEQSRETQGRALQELMAAAQSIRESTRIPAHVDPAVAPEVPAPTSWDDRSPPRFRP